MTCKLSAIVAVCDDWGIGLDGGMIVENREDLRHFVACTTGHAVIMGRRTLESLPGGRPLKNRRNVVLTRDASFSRPRASAWPTPSTARSQPWRPRRGVGHRWRAGLRAAPPPLRACHRDAQPLRAPERRLLPQPGRRPRLAPRRGAARAASPPRAFPSTSLPTSATESPRRSVYGNNGLKSPVFRRCSVSALFLASNFTVLWESTSRVRSCAGFDMNLKVVGKIFDATSENVGGVSSLLPTTV